MNNQDELIDTTAAAELLGRSYSTVRRWRKAGLGPAYEVHARKPLYRREVVEAWKNAQKNQNTN
ncbi:MAG: helix-turn-helix domain-containing protein [Magnetococcales bacterium]|nr:helix-turn-helix domain-containing protein [Magnetococcales bacterium]